MAVVSSSVGGSAIESTGTDRDGLGDRGPDVKPILHPDFNLSTGHLS
jgi:hypothetical protein